MLSRLTYQTLLLILVILTAGFVSAQEASTFYLGFEFIQVPGAAEEEWLEGMDFMTAVMRQRIESGEIAAADLFSLQPGGRDQGSQYLSITVFNDPVTMMEEETDWMGHARTAHPGMSEETIREQFQRNRELAEVGSVYYLESVTRTESDIQRRPGMVVALTWMKAPLDGYTDYEQAERELFQPLHQQRVDNEAMETWGLHRVISPMGSGARASHMTVNWYADYEQYLNSRGQLQTMIEGKSESEQERYRRGLRSREHVWTYLGNLLVHVQ